MQTAAGETAFAPAALVSNLSLVIAAPAAAIAASKVGAPRTAPAGAAPSTGLTSISPAVGGFPLAPAAAPSATGTADVLPASTVTAVPGTLLTARRSSLASPAPVSSAGAPAPEDFYGALQTAASHTARAETVAEPSLSVAVPAPAPAIPVSKLAAESADGSVGVAASLVAPIATATLTQAAPAATGAASVVVTTTPPHLAHDVGLAIARQVAADGDQLHIRLDPPELGRIDVTMAFDDRGTLRAVVAADSSVSLDLLRRDSADLSRAMSDAGVTADGQSFRFEGRGDGRSGDGGQRQPPRILSANVETRSETVDPGRFRSMNWRGQLDVLA